MAAARPSSPLFVVLLVGSALFLGFLCFPSAADNVLYPGGSLLAGQYLSQGNYSLIMQTDCNLVLYLSGRPVWASQTYGRGYECRAILKRDGNLVVYTGTGMPVWVSGTGRYPGNYVLILQPNGDVVIYGSSIWATGTGGVAEGIVSGVQETAFPATPGAFPATPGVKVVKAGKGLGAGLGGTGK